MNRLTFLKSLSAPIFAPLIANPTTEFERLELDYCKAANALTEYRIKNGFEPGVRVRCQYRDDPPKMGIISKYGDGWDSCGDSAVPVRLDSGYRQPWSMDSLTIIQP